MRTYMAKNMRMHLVKIDVPALLQIANIFHVTQKPYRWAAKDFLQIIRIFAFFSFALFLVEVAQLFVRGFAKNHNYCTI